MFPTKVGGWGFPPREATPPEDLVVAHKERYWVPPDKRYSHSDTQYRVIHCRRECLASRYPYFKLCLLDSSLVRNKLLQSHKQLLRENLRRLYRLIIHFENFST